MDSLHGRFQRRSSRFQVDLDELYRFQTTLFSKDPPYPRKTQNTAKKCRKNRPISEILSRIRFSADYNITGTGSKQISTCSIDSTTSLFPQTPPYPSKVPNTAENRENLSNTVPDWLLDRFQYHHHWFQLDFDELYRFHDSLFSIDAPLSLNRIYDKAQEK